MTAEFLLMARCCAECLTTPRRIVSEARAAELLASCSAKDEKFICHKTADVACRGVHEAVGPCLASRFASAFGIPTVLVDPDNLERHDG